MSYILDALQRSDSERAVGNIQTLDSPGRRPPPRRRVKRRGWIGWLVFLLLLLALLFALYFFRGPVIRQVEGLGVAVPAVFKSEIPGFDIGHGFAQTRTASKVKAPAQQNRRPVAVTKPESTQTPDNGVKPAVKQAQQSAPQSAPQTAPQPVAQPAPAPPQPQRQPAARVTQSELQDTASLNPPQQPVPRQPAPAPPVPAAAPAPPVQVSSAPTQAVPQSTGGNGVSAVPQGSQRPASQGSGEVESSDDLPSSMRQQLPQMMLNVVSYSQNDDKRFVMIDQKIYREGESVQGGMTIEQITEDGPIMSWRGRRFLMRP